MKKSITGAVLLTLSILAIGCEPALTLSDQVILTIQPSQTNVVLSESNHFRDTVNLDWSIQNNADKPLTTDDYELNLMSIFEKSTGATLLKSLDLNVPPHTSQSGTYEYYIDGIGEEGNYEFQLVLYKKEGGYVTEIKKMGTPYTLKWGEGITSAFLSKISSSPPRAMYSKHLSPRATRVAPS